MRTRATAAVWTVLAALLGLALAWRAWETHQANAALYRRLCQAEEEAGRLEEEGRRLRDERHALEHDPRYIERTLRERRMSEPGEVIVEPGNKPAGRPPGGGTNVPR
jgi:cell division protein FtsB